MKNKGFTLIELLVAITIMGIIVLMALPSVRRVQLDNKEQKYVAYEKTLKTAIDGKFCIVRRTMQAGSLPVKESNKAMRIFTR